MKISTQYVTSLEQLKKYFESARPTVVVGSRTSTVIPYDLLSEEICYLDTTKMKPSLSLIGDFVVVEGGVTWSELRDFLSSHEMQMMTYPTDLNAQVLASVATSATGEHAFGLGTLRDQVKEVAFVDGSGNDYILSSDIKLCNSSLMQNDDIKKIIKNYQYSYKAYNSFKNGPFPRFETESDLLIGTEGQLGVITRAMIKVMPSLATTYLFVTVPRFEHSIESHLEIFKKVQGFRQEILCCEFIDWNSQQFLPKELQMSTEKDVIALEIISGKFDYVYDQLLSKLSHTSEESIFEIESTKFHKIRQAIPQAVNEHNSAAGIIKKGTDTQVSVERFSELMEHYQSWSKLGVDYLLFGHFGDGHLHFNFLPNNEQVSIVEKALFEFYPKVLEWGGSPFAEHGIGVLKRPYIKPFYTQAQYDMFDYLKDQFDPQRILFSFGFMGIKKS